MRFTRTASWVSAVAVAAAVVAIGVFIAVALRRINQPIDLEWLEGGAVDHVRRVLHGRPIYAAPTVDHAAYEYPPVYFWVSAMVAFVTGVGYLPLRLVSLLSSVATMVVLAVAVRHEVGRWAPGVLAAGLFAAAYAVTGRFFDIARVDALSVFLLIASLALATRAADRRGLAVAGLVGGLAVLTKQTTFLSIAPVALYLAARRPRIGFVFGLVVALVAGGVSVALNVSSHGWYRYFVIDELRSQGRSARSLSAFWGADIGAHLWPALLIIGVALGATAMRRGRYVYLIGTVGMVAGSWLARVHVGSAPNVLIPTFAGVALLAGIASAEITRPSLRACAAAGLIAQFALLAYNPLTGTPQPRDVAAGDALVAAVRAAPGDVLVASHPEIAVLAGKPAHAQSVAVSDVLHGMNVDAIAAIDADFARAIHAQQFSYIVFDPGDGHAGIPSDFESYYRPVPPPYEHGHPGLPRSIMPWPTEWWAPR